MLQIAIRVGNTSQGARIIGENTCFTKECRVASSNFRETPAERIDTLRGCSGEEGE